MIVRCDDHGPPSSPTRDFVAVLEPKGYPNNAVVLCGYEGCESEGKMYLDEEEYKDNQYRDKIVFPAENQCWPSPHCFYTRRCHTFNHTELWSQ